MSEGASQPLLPRVGDYHPYAALIEREPTNNEEARECVICLDSSSEEGEITRLFHDICHSGYHRHCIDRAFTVVESKCPKCKRDISLIQNLDGSEKVVSQKIQAVSRAYADAVHQIPEEGAEEARPMSLIERLCARPVIDKIALVILMIVCLPVLLPVTLLVVVTEILFGRGVEHLLR